ncbi:MAG: hypothetical protein CMM08_08335 [Rhodospirillaceae bacterium]|jgi:hypothetical protein|nr:hypothetical protein [Rhodospirillaceae bacterium]MDP6620883.1 hypothetical protein [Alphaproteobacteria bacterium]|tara:strand:- start:383 stop:1063 length:681 start_codon:yes stop_codon:yes gene_type:complete
MQDKAPQAAIDQRDSGTLMFLGLFLLLLAFFIMLNTIASRDKSKSESAMGSVNSAFTKPSLASAFRVERVIDLDTALVPDNFSGDIYAAFSALTPAPELGTVGSSGVLKVVLATEEIFEPDLTDIRADRDDLLAALAKALSSQSPGQRREVEMLIGSGNALPRQVTAEGNLEAARIGALARALRQRGVPGINLSPGLGPGDRNEIEFFFFSRQEHAAKITFEPIVE